MTRTIYLYITCSTMLLCMCTLNRALLREFGGAYIDSGSQHNVAKTIWCTQIGIAYINIINSIFSELDIINVRPWRHQ